MNGDAFRALRETIRTESFTRTQLGDLLAEVAFRINAIESGDMEPVQQDLEEAVQDYREAVEKMDARVTYEPEPCDLARERRLLEEPI